MPQGAVGNVEVGVVQGVEITPATLVYCVKNMCADGASENGDFVLNINIIIVLCKTHETVNDFGQTPHSSLSSPLKDQRELFNSVSMFRTVCIVFLAFSWS